MILALLAAQLAPLPPSAVPVSELTATTAPSPTAVEKEHVPLQPTRDDRLTVAVTVGEAGPFRFLVDTGADRTAISRELADRLALGRSAGARMHSLTEASKVETARLEGLRVDNRTIPTITAPLLEQRHLGADGILGTDALRSSQIRFDFRRGLLSVAPARTRAPAAESGTGTIVVEARRRAGRLIVTEAEANGQRVTVVLDTGSALSIGNEALRRVLDRRGQLTKDRTIDLLSVTGQRLPASYMFVSRLDLGEVKLTGLGIAFADAHTFRAMGLENRPALLLGMNALAAFDSVTIDLSARKLRFALPAEARQAAADAVRPAPATAL